MDFDCVLTFSIEIFQGEVQLDLIVYVGAVDRDDVSFAPVKRLKHKRVVGYGMGEPDVRRNTFIILFTINNKNFIEAEQKLFLNGFI